MRAAAGDTRRREPGAVIVYVVTLPIVVAMAVIFVRMTASAVASLWTRAPIW